MGKTKARRARRPTAASRKEGGQTRQPEQSTRLDSTLDDLMARASADGQSIAASSTWLSFRPLVSRSHPEAKKPLDMYWPLNVARRIVPPLLPPDNDEPPEGVALDDDIDDAIQLSPSPSSHHSQHFSIITPRSLHIYTTRPTQVIASLRRTRKSIQDYGRNVRASWKPTTTTSSSNDRGRITIVVETSSSYVLVYHVKPSADEMAYLYVPTSSSSQASASKKPWAPSSKSLKSTFAAASGEGPAGAFSLDISLRLALRVDATLACCLATPEYLLVSTVNPPAIQAIPWPGEKDGSTGSETKTTLLSSLTWFRGGDATKEQPLPHVTTIAHSRRMDLYVWLTSDGQGYVASLKVDGEVRWQPNGRAARQSSLYADPFHTLIPSCPGIYLERSKIPRPSTCP